ncbi:LysR family transcriptional regulator [Bordetella sp. 15P40C-2]|uniref:LysR family transcriptional regulator n=1 Tax=Bordetella sp. 15P40C-2 TaxID=2572246 RepID=UPI001328BECA|nr:LysR family transcriptional regulator [Bordetella sp. 15P40C-2]MVW72406.1 LysR family transcriptional regulator [Bordetella sp. 15P40C-2]
MIREFKTFIAAARDGTFTGAGRSLGLTQSAVSAQMRRLEDYLGVELFERTGKSAMLNAAGRDLLPQAEDLVAMAERMAVSVGAGRVKGLLRIGAIASVQQHLLVGALKDFRETFPDVRVRVMPGVSLSLLGQVDAGEIDMAVMLRPPFALPPELAWRPLAREPIVLAVPADFPAQSWREALSTQPFIRYDRSSFGGRLVDLFLKKQRIVVQEAVELDEMDAIANLVRGGLGVALVPRTRQFDARGLRLDDLGEAGFHREIGLIAPLSLEPGSPVAHLIECFERASRN